MVRGDGVLAVLSYMYQVARIQKGLTFFCVLLTIEGFLVAKSNGSIGYIGVERLQTSSKPMGCKEFGNQLLKFINRVAAIGHMGEKQVSCSTR